MGEKLVVYVSFGIIIIYSYCLLFFWLLDYLKFIVIEIKNIVNIYWVISSFFLFLLVGYNFKFNLILGLIIVIFLICYVIM